MRYAWSVFISLAVTATTWAQNAEPTSTSSTGLKLGKVPELFYAQFPRLQRDCGVAVYEVKHKSLGAEIGLHPYDIVVSCNNVSVKSEQQLLYLITQNAGENIPLAVLRQGQMLKYKASPSMAWRQAVELPKAALKRGGPPAIRVTAEPLAGGRYKIDFQYYHGSGKLKTLRCNGTLSEIRDNVRQLNKQKVVPDDVYDLVGAALKRISQLDSSNKSVP